MNTDTMTIYKTMRGEMLCDLCRAIHDYCNVNRVKKKLPIYMYEPVEFFDESGNKLGELEAHTALEWLANDIWYSDEIDLSDACKISVRF